MTDLGTIYLCQVIEYISRKNEVWNKDTVERFTRETMDHVYNNAETFHYLSIEQAAGEIEEFIKPQVDLGYSVHVTKGCHYYIPEWYMIGSTYGRLVNDLGGYSYDRVKEVYNSFICKFIDDYNLDLWFQNPAYIRDSYLLGDLIDD